jgi:hypothetical protein
LAILKIQVHRDRSKELADNRRFTLAANIEVYSATRKARGSAGRKKCGEKPLPTVAQETSFEWNGYVRNAFGVEIISWKGHATYSYQNGKLLTPDPCPNRSCLNVKHDTFWQVDNDATVVKTQAFANRQPEEALLTYQIIWSVAFPKMDFDKFKLELPPPSGNAIAVCLPGRRNVEQE